MLIDAQLCTGCWECIDYCPVDAISQEEGVATIILDLCVECGTCFRSAPCPTSAIQRDELEWPRALRQWFSDPTMTNPKVKSRSLGAGRGVDEVKNNDRTGYYKGDEAGFIVEMGRPGVSASFADVERLLVALAGAGFQVVERSPVVPFMEDVTTGKVKEEVLGERMLSCSIEFKMTIERVSGFLAALKRIEPELPTVFTVGLLSIIRPDLSIPTMDVLNELGVAVQPNAKINLGFGRPLAPKYPVEAGGAVR